MWANTNARNPDANTGHSDTNGWNTNSNSLRRLSAELRWGDGAGATGGMDRDKRRRSGPSVGDFDHHAGHRA